MTTFSEDLRKAREAKNISLAEISRLTRINVKYLEAIDQGSFDVLPQTYIRAFLREYAQAVGLSPVEVIQKYDVLVTGKYAAGPTPPPASGGSGGAHIPTLHEPPRDAENAPPSEETLVKQRSMRTVVIVASIVLLCSLILAYVANYIWVDRNGSGVRETPFADVVREQETKKNPPAADTLQAAKKDSTAGAAAAPQVSDSLTLTIQPSERVLVNIQRDTLRFSSMMLDTSSPVSLRAKRRFVLTLGNAGGVSLALNGRDLGIPGKRGDVVRNIVVTADGIADPGVKQVKQTGEKR